MIRITKDQKEEVDIIEDPGSKEEKLPGSNKDLQVASYMP